MKTVIRISLTVVALFLAVFVAIATNSHFSKAADDRKRGTEPQWEYLIVSGGSANLTTSGNDNYLTMRKQPDGSFRREFFPLVRNLDKSGATGWELVSVHGSQNDPVYVFKRLKEGVKESR